MKARKRLGGCLKVFLRVLYRWEYGSEFLNTEDKNAILETVFLFTLLLIKIWEKNIFKIFLFGDYLFRFSIHSFDLRSFHCFSSFQFIYR